MPPFDPAGWSPARRDALADALREHIAATGGWKTQFFGGSMEPAIPGGSRLDVEALPAELHAGDLLVCVLPVTVAVCCHRVLALRDDGAALTQGDACSAADGWIARSCQIGVVRRYWVGGRCFTAGPRNVASPLPSTYRRVRQRMAGWASAVSR